MPRGDLVWRRIEGATGVLFVVITLASFATGGNSPNANAPGAEARDWYVANRAAALRSAYLLTLASGLLLWFVGVLTATLGRAEGGDRLRARVAFGGGVLAAGSLFAIAAVVAGQAFSASPTMSPDISAALRGVHRGFVPAYHVTMAVFILAASVVIIGTRALPAWLGWSGVALALLRIVGASSMMFRDEILGMDGAVESSGVLLGLVWILVASVILMPLETRRVPEGSHEN